MHYAFEHRSTCWLFAAAVSMGCCINAVGQGIDKAVPAGAVPADPAKRKGYIGLSVDNVPEAVRAQTPLEEGFGLSVVFVVPGGPGDNAGLRRYDILSKFNDQRLTNPMSLSSLASEKTPGEEVALTVLRRDQVHELQVTVGDFRDAPVGIRNNTGQEHSDPLLEFLLKLFRRGGAGNGIDLKTTPEGDFRLEWNESMDGLLTGFRNRSGDDGIRLETLDVRQSTIISTPEMNITITSDSKNIAPWIVAYRKKDGEQVFAGPLNDDTPLKVRRIIESTPRKIRVFPELPTADGR